MRPTLPSECDWIVRKATDPDPARRYQSVDALVEDVRRLADGRAVLAHPPSAIYTLRRAVRRRPYLTTAIAGTVITVSTLGIVTAVQAARLSVKNEQLSKAVARAETGEANAKTEAAAHAEAVAAVTTAIYSLTYQIMYNPYLHRADAANAFVKAMEPRADRLPPESRMRFHERLRHLYEATGKHEQALVHAQKALDACLQLNGEPRRNEARIRKELAFTYRKLGQSIEGTAEAQRALQIATNEFGPNSDEVIGARTEIAFCIGIADREAGIAEARRAKAIAALSDPKHAAAFGLYIVPWLREVNRHEQAVREGLEDISVLEKAGAGAKKVALMLKYRVAQAYVDLGQLAEAAKLLEFVVQVRSKRDPITYVRRLEAVRLYAEALVRLGKHGDSIPHFDHAIGVEQTADPRGTRIARLRFLCAAAHSAMGRHEQARPLFYLAASRGSHDGTRDGSAKFDADFKLLTDALKAGDWRVDPSLNERLGKFSWMGTTAIRKSLPIEPDDEPEPSNEFSTGDPMVQTSER